MSNNNNEDIIFNLDINTSRSETSVRKLETILYRALGLYNRICRLLGVPEDSQLNQLITKVQGLVMLLRQMTTAALLMETASGPIGWAMAGIGVAGVTVSTIEFMQSVGE